MKTVIPEEHGTFHNTERKEYVLIPGTHWPRFEHFVVEGRYEQTEEWRQVVGLYGAVQIPTRVLKSEGRNQVLELAQRDACETIRHMVYGRFFETLTEIRKKIQEMATLPEDISYSGERYRLYHEIVKETEQLRRDLRLPDDPTRA